MLIYFSLFGLAFLSATVLPGGSEVLLVTALNDGRYSVFWLWLFASVGNTLGSIVGWLLGRYLLHYQDRRWFPVSAKRLARAEQAFNTRGSWALLFAWVPVIGDALTIAAGLLRVPLPVFVLFVAIGKAFRYALVIAAALGAFSAFA